MNRLIFILCFIGSLARADGDLFLPNIPGYATGTASGGKNSLDVNITSPISVLNPSDGLTGSAVPSYGNYVAGNKAGNLTGLLIGQQTMANSLACNIASDQSAIPVTGTFSSASVGPTGSPVPGSADYAGFLDGSGNLVGAKVNASQALTVDGSAVTQPVSAVALPLPSGAATSALQSTGITALGTINTTLGSPMQQTGGSLSVTNFPATQPVSGTVAVTQSTSPWVNNTSQINGVVPLMGNGVTGTGSQRVTIASDNTAFTVNAAQSGTWTVQPGNTANTTAWLVNSQAKTPTALTVKQAAVTVGTSAVRLTNDGSAPPSTRALLEAQLIGTSAANCYIGSSGVTSSGSTRGVQAFAGQTNIYNNDAGDYYAICDTSSQTFLITEQE